MQLAIRHPRAVGRLVVASAPFRRDGMVDGFWDGLAAATYADLPAPYREADLAASGDPGHAERMFRPRPRAHADRLRRLARRSGRLDNRADTRGGGRPRRGRRRAHCAPGRPYPERAAADRARKSWRLCRRAGGRGGRYRAAAADASFPDRFPGPAFLTDILDQPPAITPA